MNLKVFFIDAYVCKYFFHITSITVVHLISGVSRSDGLGQYFAREKKVIESWLSVLAYAPLNHT